jgi:hypothetical protein
MVPVEWFAMGSGLGSGALAGWLHTRLSRNRTGDYALWSGLASLAQSLISPCAEQPFLTRYLRLWPVLLRYIAKKTVVIMLAFFPVALAFAGASAMADGSAVTISHGDLLAGISTHISATHKWLGMTHWEFLFALTSGLASVSFAILLRFMAWTSRQPIIS